MKKSYYLCVLILLFLFIPKVYALTYDIDVLVDNTSVSVGTVKEIKVSLKNINATENGIDVCSMNISFEKNILLNSSIKTLNDWDLTTGDMYLFDSDPVFDDVDMFLIPVKINGNGSVKLSNIFCSDGADEVSFVDKEIKFTVVATESNSNSNNNGSNNNSSSGTGNTMTEEDNCNLSNIMLSEGTIEFDTNVTEYSVYVTDMDNFSITPILENSKASYLIDENVSEEGKNIVVTVTAPSGNTKIYTIYVNDDLNDSDESEDDKKNNDFTIIFIVIICVLVIINVYRIIKNLKK